MIVCHLPTRRSDLERIGDHIAEASPERAISFVQELRDACEGLRDMSERFPLVPRFEHAGIRPPRARELSDFLSDRRRNVDVIHVLHGAMDYEPLLFPRGERKHCNSVGDATLPVMFYVCSSQFTANV